MRPTLPWLARPGGEPRPGRSEVALGPRVNNPNLPLITITVTTTVPLERPVGKGHGSVLLWTELADTPSVAEGVRAATRTGLVYGEVFLGDEAGAGLECPERVVAIVDRLKRAGLMEELVWLEPVAAGPEWIGAVHSAEYVKRAAQEEANGSSSPAYKAARHAAGGVQTAIDAVMEGRVRNAFCAMRPPGHLALPDQAVGDCRFNSVAIGARYLQKKHQLAKVLIVDWDVHHGLGTQVFFDSDPTVFYFSVHQSGSYPGSGSEGYNGSGAGRCTTLNVPLSAGSGDEEYRQVLTQRLRPAAAAFKPDFVLISAGFDAAPGDPRGQMEVSPEGFADMTRIVKGIAEEYCDGRLVSVLEGGYNLQALAASVEAHVRILISPQPQPQTIRD
jgi:acetoin utilization deacetylase AcuC-like enzyme